MTPDHLSPQLNHEKWKNQLNERPFLGPLKVGSHVRNVSEIIDIWGFIDHYSRNNSEPEYVGLVGSRQVGKIYWNHSKLKRYWGHELSEKSIAYLASNLPILGANIDGRDVLPIPEFEQYVDMSPPSANEFYYDVDIVLVQDKNSRPLDVKRRIGEKSGTLIEIFAISSRILIENSYKEIQEYFLNSQRISR